MFSHIPVSFLTIFNNVASNVIRESGQTFLLAEYLSRFIASGCAHTVINQTVIVVQTVITLPTHLAPFHARRGEMRGAR